MEGMATDIHNGHEGGTRFLNRSTTVPDAPRVGCATDGIATDVYCLDGGYGYNLRYTRRLLHCVRNDSKGGLEAIGMLGEN